MVSTKTILIINIVVLLLVMIYYFRVEITGFVSDTASIMLRIMSLTSVRLTTSINQSSFCPGESANMTNIIENIGSTNTTGNLTTIVNVPSGPIFFSDNWNNIDLRTNQLKSFESLLNFTSSDEIGRYFILSNFYYESEVESTDESFFFKNGIGILTASPPQIEKTIKRGDSDTQIINMWLRYACDNTNVYITKASGKPGDWVNFSSSSVSLTPFILGETIVNITIPENETLGDYSSLITLTADGQVITIPLTIHVIRRDFEINITVMAPENAICLGSVADAIVNITKSNIPGEIEMNVTYQILDPDSILVDNSSEVILITTNVVRNPSLTVPLSSSTGYYTYLAVIQYEEISEQSSDIFEVEDCRPKPPTIGGGGGGAPGGAGPKLNYSMSIDVSTNIISSIPGDKETLLVTVKNTGNVDLKSVRLSVEGIPSTWIKIVPNEVDIPPSRSQEYLVVLNIPNNAGSGTYVMKIKAVSRIESETKTVKLIIGKTLEELANLMLEEMEGRRSIAIRAILTKECLDLSKIIPLFEEAEKSREKGLSDYRSKNYDKAVDWFENAIKNYNQVIDQVDVKIEVKIDLLKIDKLGFLPIIGLKNEIANLEGYYLNKNYEVICEPVLEASRLKKLSLILWILLLILIPVFITAFLIIIRRSRERDKRETMERVRKRLGEFHLETVDGLENKEENP